MFGNPEEDEDNTPKYLDRFYADQLHKLIKLSGLSQKLHIYTDKDKPLFINCNIGTIGNIKIYIKSINQIEN